jgi:hypothetical protein
MASELPAAYRRRFREIVDGMGGEAREAAVTEAVAALVEAVEPLWLALELACSHPAPHRGRWHQPGHARGSGCVGCVLEDAALGEHLK